MTCEFCEDYELAKIIGKEIEKRDTDFIMNTHLKLTDRHIDKDGNVRGVHTHGLYDINFCPVCGKSLKGEEACS